MRGRLSVRAAEALVRQLKSKGSKSNEVERGKTAPGKTAAVRDLESRLTRSAGTKVLLKQDGKNDKKGEIPIPYEDLDHLDRILARVFRFS